VKINFFKNLPWIAWAITILLFVVGQVYQYQFTSLQPDLYNITARDNAATYIVYSTLGAFLTFLIMLTYYFKSRERKYLWGLLLPLPIYLVSIYTVANFALSYLQYYTKIARFF
jgi:hypothetical protein